MQDNELYMAIREGRVPLRVEIEQRGEKYAARYEGFGIDITVEDASQTFAQSEVLRQVMDKVRSNEFVVKVA